VIYLTIEEILAINARLVRPGQLRDQALLESAVARPQASVGGKDAYPDLHAKAAALFHSIVSNHLH
jgi:death-on-curing protein